VGDAVPDFVETLRGVGKSRFVIRAERDGLSTSTCNPGFGRGGRRRSGRYWHGGLGADLPVKFRFPGAGNIGREKRKRQGRKGRKNAQKSETWYGGFHNDSFCILK
jgi:hypothetical protein